MASSMPKAHTAKAACDSPILTTPSSIGLQRASSILALRSAATFQAQRTKLPRSLFEVLGGLREHLRFFHLVDPAITRKRTIFGQAVKSQASLDIVEIEPLGVSMPMYDITTGTGDFIANGVVSHNCYARPAHSYVNLSPGLDFETKLFYKENAAELLQGRVEPAALCLQIH